MRGHMLKTVAVDVIGTVTASCGCGYPLVRDVVRNPEQWPTHARDQLRAAHRAHVGQKVAEKQATMSTPTLVRVASPQAWKRLRTSLSIGERNDIAADIASHLEDPSLVGAIADALSSVVWDVRKQG